MLEQDEKRRQEFKKHEMEKEHKRRESMKNMTAEERKAADEKEKAHHNKPHEKLHEPVSCTWFCRHRDFLGWIIDELILNWLTCLSVNVYDPEQETLTLFSRSTRDPLAVSALTKLSSIFPILLPCTKDL